MKILFFLTFPEGIISDSNESQYNKIIPMKRGTNILKQHLLETYLLSYQLKLLYSYWNVYEPIRQFYLVNINTTTHNIRWLGCTNYKVFHEIYGIFNRTSFQLPCVSPPNFFNESNFANFYDFLF